MPEAENRLENIQNLFKTLDQIWGGPKKATKLGTQIRHRQSKMGRNRKRKEKAKLSVTSARDVMKT